MVYFFDKHHRLRRHSAIGRMRAANASGRKIVKTPHRAAGYRSRRRGRTLGSRESAEVRTKDLIASTSIESSALKQKGKIKRRLVVAVLMVTSILAMPTESHAGIFSVFDAIFSLIKGPIGDDLKSIDSITRTVQQLYQQTVYPLKLINQARGSISNSISTYRNYMNGIFHAPLRSAILPGPLQFETILHSGDSTQLAALQQSFISNFGTVPVANAAHPQDRLMMDIDDTLGQENLKTTVISDQGENTILAVADSIENQAATTAPGSAPLLTAQAQVANIRSQAFIQKMLAAELHQEAGRIAHNNVLMKRRTQNGGSVSNTIINSLTGQN